MLKPLALVLCILAAAAAYSQSSTARRVGYFSASSPTVNAPRLAAFRRGMGELGWVEGNDYIVDARYADGNPSNIAQLAHDVVASRPDIILTPGDEAIRALANATTTIPIVFATSVDPVRLGVAKSLQHPGGNVTGLTTLRAPLGAKSLELLKQAFPHVTTVAVLFTREDLSTSPQRKEVDDAAPRLGVRITSAAFDRTTEPASAVKEAVAAGCQAFLVLDGYVMNTRRAEVVAAINASRLPAIFPRAEHVEAGALMSYSSSTVDNFRKSAAYVDKILKGTKPGELPIEQPSKFDLTINLKTAKATGINIPELLLVRADKVVQ
jgi:putative ABC transport system substrate-binding protein